MAMKVGLNTRLHQQLPLAAPTSEASTITTAFHFACGCLWFLVFWAKSMGPSIRL